MTEPEQTTVAMAARKTKISGGAKRVERIWTPRMHRRLKDVETDQPSVLGLFQRVFDGTASPRQAIKAQCLDCCGLSKATITECTATACPLWMFRPYQPKRGQAPVDSRGNSVRNSGGVANNGKE